MPERKAEEFVRLMMKHRNLRDLDMANGYDFEIAFNHLADMSDLEWDGIMRKILVNRSRDPNIGAFSLPELDRELRIAMFELIMDNHVCGIHNSYWSRIIWMVKGDRLVKAFPPNAKMEQFERGERRAP